MPVAEDRVGEPAEGERSNECAEGRAPPEDPEWDAAPVWWSISYDSAADRRPATSLFCTLEEQRGEEKPGRRRSDEE